jgi:hypothetical protein
MLKKSFYALVIGVFAVMTVSAQAKVDKFIGTWQLTKVEGSGKSSNLKSMILNVSQSGGELKIERDTQSSAPVQNNAVTTNNSLTQTNLFKINGNDSFSVISGQFGGRVRSQMRFLSADKLRFDTEVDKDFTVTNSRELWTVSSDGKTLTVETASRFQSKNRTEDAGGVITSKFIFTKQ